jgi:hypothetical protein
MIQGVSNTGNALNNTNALQYASTGEIQVGDSGNFTISPEQNKGVSKVCDQQANQAASASGN